MATAEAQQIHQAPPSAAPVRGRVSGLAGGHRTALVVLLGPFLALLLVFQILPLLLMLRNSTLSYTLLNPARTTFVGLDNYTDIFTSSSAGQSVLVTLGFCVGLVVLIVPTSLLMAVFLNGRLPARALIRTIIYLPVITSLVVVATMWQFLLDPTSGPVNSLSRALGLGTHSFLTEQATALITLIVIGVWQQFGFATVLFLAGLQGIPEDVLEAARVDGASTARLLWYIIVPLLSRTTLFVVVVMTIFGLQAFAQAFVITNGGPGGQTNFLVYNIYKTAFMLQKPGLASALSVILLGLALLFSLVQMRLLRSRWSY